jgi:peroxiredoxin
MKKRLTYLRTAIIQASDRSIGSSTVADIATDELYVIRFLSKGRVAPDLTGTDVGGRVIRLSEQRGKTVILLFWDAKSPDTDKIIELTNNLAVKYEGKPVSIIGVTPEAFDRIRALQADGSIKWNNIIDPDEKLSGEYRIASRPALLVIGADGKIEYTGLPGSFVELTVDALLSGSPGAK